VKVAGSKVKGQASTFDPVSGSAFMLTFQITNMYAAARSLYLIVRLLYMPSLELPNRMLNTADNKGLKEN